MKKIFLILFLLLVLVSCRKEEVLEPEYVEPDPKQEEKEQKEDKEKEPEIIDDPVEPEPVIVNVSNTEDNMEVLRLYLDNYSKLPDFEINESGSTTAKKLFISYEQKTTSKTTKENNNYYYQCDTNSTFVNKHHEAIYEADKVKYKNNDEEFIETTFVEYKKAYGISPKDYAIYGFIINENTVLEITREQVDDLFVFVIKIDGEKAGTNCKIQMKEYGDLSKYPVFEEVSITLKITNDFIPKEIIYEAKYKIDAAFLGEMVCSQKMISTYTYKD